MSSSRNDANSKQEVDVYVDSSVVLRIVLGQGARLASWPLIDRPIASELIRVECLRRIDRARISAQLPDAEVATRRAAILEVLRGFSLVPVTTAILERAAEPFPTALGSLDAIHLATALLVRDQVEGLSVATHDAELGLAARAVGFEVEG